MSEQVVSEQSEEIKEQNQLKHFAENAVTKPAKHGLDMTHMERKAANKSKEMELRYRITTRDALKSRTRRIEYNAEGRLREEAQRLALKERILRQREAQLVEDKFQKLEVVVDALRDRHRDLLITQQLRAETLRQIRVSMSGHKRDYTLFEKPGEVSQVTQDEMDVMIRNLKQEKVERVQSDEMSTNQISPNLQIHNRYRTFRDKRPC